MDDKAHVLIIGVGFSDSATIEEKNCGEDQNDDSERSGIGQRTTPL
jgi:hypothetical protein